MTCRSKVIKMELGIFYYLIVFYDLGVPSGHELDRFQERVKTTSCSVLTGWQLTKLIYLVVVVLKFIRIVLEPFGSLSTHMWR